MKLWSSIKTKKHIKKGYGYSGRNSQAIGRGKTLSWQTLGVALRKENKLSQKWGPHCQECKGKEALLKIQKESGDILK